MRVFLLSLDLNLWHIVENGFEMSSLPMNQWNVLEKKMFSLNANAMNALFCALDKNEFNRVSLCETAFDIWHTLEITHEGTSRVKDSKINFLMHDFEFFRMKPSETIVDMYTRFTDIVNSLQALGKCFSNFELVSKVLRSLSKAWESKVTAIQETKDLNIFPLEELIGSLMTYEMVRNAHDEHNEHLNHLPKNRKDLELRTNEYHLSNDSSDDDNDELEFRTLNLNKFIKQKSKMNNELERRKRPKKRKAKDESRTSKGEMANWALTGFEYKVSNSTLLNYFEIT